MDLRYAIRVLSSKPGFAALAIAILAVGIGINTVVFTIYGSVVFRQLPVRSAGDMVRFDWRSNGTSSDQFSWSEYNQLAASLQSFESVIATSAPQPFVCRLLDSTSTRSEVVRVRLVSMNYFAALGIRPESGRLLGRADREVAVVSHAFWKTVLGSDPEAAGKTLRIQDAALTIVGVAPDTFAGTGVPPQAPDLWVPASAQTLLTPGADRIHDSYAREWQLLARRKPAVTSARYSAELSLLSHSWPLEAGKPVQLGGEQAKFFDATGGAFDGFLAVCSLLMIATGLVLLIACVNLTNLIAARNSGRGQEVAVRLALGASRWRLVKQFCAESLLLGAVGGFLGLFLSEFVCEWLGTKIVELMQEITKGALVVSLDLSPDWRVLFWTATLSITVGIAVGILPALRAAAGDVNSTLKHGGAGGDGGSHVRHHRNILLSAQIASCLILLASAGLLFRGAVRSTEASPGFDVKHLAVVGMDLRTIAASAPARLNLARQALTGMRTLPAVESVAWSDRLPFLGTGSGTFQNERGSLLRCVFNGVSDDYFTTLGISTLEGRTFTRQEVDQQLPIAVISESTAQRLWPKQDALGKRILPSTSWLRQLAGQTSFTVVGVVKSVRSTYLSKEDGGYVYIPRQLPDSAVSFLVRTYGPPDRSFRYLAAALAKVSANLPARTYITSMEDGPLRIQELMASAPATVAFVLGGLALILSCVGIFGVVSYLVSQRTREIGIRMALGATRWQIISTVASQTLQPVSWGLGIGLLGALVVSGLLRSLIAMPDVPDLTYGAGAFSALTFFGSLSVLCAVIMIAAFMPMRRATLIEPATALRNE